MRWSDSKFAIVIPTRNRVGRQITRKQFEGTPFEDNVWLCCPSDESHPYPTIHRPEGLKGIQNVRQWIADQCKADYLFMFDDDLRFKGDIQKGVDELIGFLDANYSYVGFQNRYLSNLKSEYMFYGPPSMCYGFRMKDFKELGVRFNDLPLMEDWHVALSFQEAHRPVIFTQTVLVSSESSGTVAGGCDYRTPQMVEDCILDFAALHPKTVRIYPKRGRYQGQYIPISFKVFWKKAVSL